MHVGERANTARTPRTTTRAAMHDGKSRINEFNARCPDCHQSITRRRAREPLQVFCATCTSGRQPIAQLRAYLRSAQKLALALGLPTSSARSMKQSKPPTPESDFS